MTLVGKEKGVKLILFYLLVQIQLYPVIPISKEKLVDTNGAGDAFVGGKPSALAGKLMKAVTAPIICGGYANRGFS